MYEKIDVTIIDRIDERQIGVVKSKNKSDTINSLTKTLKDLCA